MQVRLAALKAPRGLEQEAKEAVSTFCRSLKYTCLQPRRIPALRRPPRPAIGVYHDGTCSWVSHHCQRCCRLCPASGADRVVYWVDCDCIPTSSCDLDIRPVERFWAASFNIVPM